MLYIRAAKPRMAALFALTVLVALLLSGERRPSRILVVMAATTVTVAGAALLNNYLERRLDARMPRTRRRPTATGELRPARALTAGLLLIVAGVTGVVVVGGVLAAALAVVGAAYYVIAYTMLLKPHTALSALPGGLAGVFPAAIGWAAAGTPAAPQVMVLCALIFLWSPAHFWSLSLALEDEYATAGIPTPAVAWGARAAALQVLAAATAVLALTAGIIPLGWFGSPYAVAAVLTGAAFCGLAAWLALDPTRARAWLVYKLSGPYLGVVCLAMLF